MKGYNADMKTCLRDRAALAGAAALLLAGLTATAGVAWCAVDPMSESPYMPHEAPANGEKGGVVRIVAARDEYEPGSLVLVSDADLGKVQVELPDLKTADGKVFPKSRLDLKNVKVWYQNHNAWYSYFQDTRLKLCPELLLNDEDLVMVDEQKGWNYARLTGKDGKVTYRWLNPPRQIDSRLEDAYRMYSSRYVQQSFSCMREDFSDAPVFAGVTLGKGVHKQLFLTAHVTADQPAGLYKGAMKVMDGKEQVASIPVSLRVLDFTLPAPGCYFDHTRPFGIRFNQYISLEYIMAANGNNLPLAKRQLVAILSNFTRHGDRNPNYRDRNTYPEFGREAGQDFANHFYNGGDMILAEKAEMRYRARRMKEAATELAGGWHRPFLAWNNEYPLRLFRKVRDIGMVGIFKDAGFRFACEMRVGYEADAHLYDRWWPPTSPDQVSAEVGVKVNKMGLDFGWYAIQHVGVENPAYCRRQYGFGPYRAGLTMNANYAQHLSGWNDIANDLYKPMMLVYGTGNGCVDTIAWEGFREGQDDIRYATLLQQLAAPLLHDPAPAVREPARKAIKLLADADGDDMDLTALRLEMIGHIEILRKLKATEVRE